MRRTLIIDKIPKGVFLDLSSVIKLKTLDDVSSLYLQHIHIETVIPLVIDITEYKDKGNSLSEFVKLYRGVLTILVREPVAQGFLAFFDTIHKEPWIFPENASIIDLISRSKTSRVKELFS